MSSFSELLANSNSRSPVDVQADAKRDFASRVSQSGLVLREPNEPPPSRSRIVVGVASYSPEELRLLDEIASQKSVWSANGIEVEVFDLVSCQSGDDVNTYLPGNTRNVRQSPVVGIWSHGQLQCVETGLHSVRKALENRGILL